MFCFFFSKGQPVCFLQHSLSRKQRSFIIILAHLSLAEVCQFIFFTHKIVHTVFENTDICEEERKNHTPAAVTQWQLVFWHIACISHPSSV